MRNVCPECEANIVPRLHSSLTAAFTCNHRLAAMTPEELRAMFPAAVQVMSEVLSKHITEREALENAPQHA